MISPRELCFPISCRWSLSITPGNIRNLRFFDVSRVHWKRIMAWNGLSRNVRAATPIFILNARTYSMGLRIISNRDWKKQIDSQIKRQVHKKNFRGKLFWFFSHELSYLPLFELYTILPLISAPWCKFDFEASGCGA